MDRLLRRTLLALFAGLFPLFADGEPDPDRLERSHRGDLGNVHCGDSNASSAGDGEGQYPAGEPPQNAIDGSAFSKYLNFGTGGSDAVNSTTGIGTGFYVTPSSGPSLLTGVRVQTANDAPQRDPLSVSIEGANLGDLTLGATMTLIGSVNLGIDDFSTGASQDRMKDGPIVPLVSNLAYTHYRVLVQSQRDSAVAVQYAEMTLFGTVAAIPEPSSALAVGAVWLSAVTRRRVSREKT